MPRMNPLEQPFGSLPDLIHRHAQQRGAHPALMCNGLTLDYAGLDRQMDQVAARLQQAGLKPGDVIALCAGTSIDYVVAFMGGLRAGMIAAPLAPSSSAAHLQAMLDNAQPRVLFLDAAALERLPANVTHDWPCVSLDDGLAGEPLQAWLAAAGVNPQPQPVTPQPDWDFNLIYSSGTTGVPKGILQPWRMRWAQIQRGHANHYDADTVNLVATPLYSNTTLVSVIPTLGLGGTCVLMTKFDVRTYLELAQAHHATHTMLVPVQYQRLMDFPDFDHYDLHSFKAKFCTSAPFRADLKRQVMQRWPGRLTEYYGMTEGGGRCELYASDHPDKLHTVGRPAAGHDIRLIDEHGVEVGPGESGEVVGHSAAIMKGYHRMPDKTREVEWHDATGKRFIRTGDVGRFDADGFLILGDRKKDMIITGGFNVYPSDIEAELRQHLAVKECAVVGVPSHQWGETPVAYVVTQPTSTITATALRDFVNERVGKTQRVADLLIVPALPRSEIGKVLKRELREQYIDSRHPPLPYIERTRVWYETLGYANPYRYAHFDDVPFTPLTQPLSECRVALLTSAAPYQADKGPQDARSPYNAAAKFYQVYSGDTALDHDLRVSHVMVDRHHLSDDSNTWFPLPALRRAVARGEVGELAARFHGVPTNRSQRHTLEVDAPEVLRRCQADGVNVAVLVPNCPVCHQTMSLVARHLEAHGIATVIMGAALDIVEHCGVPRLLFSDLPLGHSAGLPYDTASQDATLSAALSLLNNARHARTTQRNAVRWPGDPDWKRHYLSVEGLSAEDIARLRAENDAIKATAQQVRDSTLS
jgi:acyl-CoA synthetase (AMP-forming)/AMP-acid ligase II